MEADRKYIAYLKEKGKLSFNYQGYDLGKILAMDLVSEIYLNPPLKFKTLRYFLLAFGFKSLSGSDRSKTLFSIGRFPRKDYYEIVAYVRSSSKASDFLDFNTLKPSFHFDLAHVFFAIKHVFQNTDLSLKSKLFLSCQLSFYLNTIAELERTRPVYKNYCAFSGIHHLETILTFYFKKSDITTYSLQHGVYYIFKDQVPLDVIIYENLVSDIQLCWGQYTADEFIDFGIPKESLLVAGYPRNLARRNPPRTLNKAKCVVLLARYTYEHSNKRLIAILKAFSTKHKVDINLKLHPSLNVSVYKEICLSNGWELVDTKFSLTEIFEKRNFGWAIAVNTAAYYEAYLNFLPCLRFNDGTFEDSLHVFQNNFEHLEGLESHFQTIPFEHSDELKTYFELADKRLRYILGLGIDRYSILNEN